MPNARLLSLLLPAFCVVAEVGAQCGAAGSWTSLGPLPSPHGSVHAICEWDPDGAGPLGVQIVCGGDFALVGSGAAANVVLYDPVARSWAPLGAGFDGPVRALCVTAGGELIAGGGFAQSAGVSVAGIARWNGASWGPLGGGADGSVAALVVLPSGDLVAGGAFSIVGGVACTNIARWNGSTWQPFGGGLGGLPSLTCWPSPAPGPQVRLLDVRSNGELIAAGIFSPGDGLARWNGTAWSGLGVPPGELTALRVLANDDVLVGVRDCGQATAQRWDGAGWSTLGVAEPTSWSAFFETSAGELLGGRLDPFSVIGDVLEWNGTGWSTVGNQQLLLNEPAQMLELAGGDVLVAQREAFAVGPSLRRLVGGAARAPAPGLDVVPSVFESQGNRTLLAGFVRQVGVTAVREIAVLEDGVVDDLAGGLLGQVFDATFTASGDVVAVGFFEGPGGSLLEPVLRWNGAQWQAVGAPSQLLGFGAAVSVVHELDGGDLVVGAFSPAPILRWHGAGWSTMGQLPFGVQVNGFVETGAGLFAFASGTGLGVVDYVWRWTGATWVPLPGLQGTFGGGRIGVELPNGDLVFAGSFDYLGRQVPLIRWNGTSWQPMPGVPSDLVRDLEVLPGGDLLVVHASRNQLGYPIEPLSRWDGTTWTSIPSVDLRSPFPIAHAELDDRGRLTVAGSFGIAQGVVAGGLARLDSACPAASVPVGAGCSGVNGPVATTVRNLPWLGDQFVARTTGVPANAVAVSVLGLQAAQLALSSVLPQAGAGCSLHASPDALSLLLPVAGAVETRLAVPVHPALIGGAFRHQVVAIELGAAGITNVTSSGAYELTIGSW